VKEHIKRKLGLLAGERGQSIIILALAVVVLLAFVGIAIDVGLLYGRRIQLSRAVDAAALAGALELPDGPYQDRAEQFVRTNGFDPVEANVIAAPGVGVGQSNYLTVTAQLPMDTMFLRFVGFPTVHVPALAVAEFKSPIEVYASQHSESGVIGAVNLNVFGKDSNPQYGDAFMGTDWSGPGDCSVAPTEANPWWWELEGKYPFRIHVPADYVDLNGGREIQVEILDPDCWNTDENEFDVEWVDGTIVDDMVPNETDRRLVAVVESGDPYNQLWQVRMDQYLGFCGYGGAQPMTTRYTLYYYKPNDLTKHQIAQYSKGCEPDTDLEWVVPSGFLFDLDDYSDVMTDEDGNKSFYIDIEGLDGTYGNGFDLWAGPPPTVTLPSNVNERNVYLLDKILNEETNPHDSGEVVVWAIGYLPLNVNTTTSFTITLGYLPYKVAGTSVRISSWDMDRNETGAPCYCNQPGHNCLGLNLDYYLEGVPLSVFQEEGTVSCSTQWANDVFEIPHEFYGGYLYAVYHTTAQDTTDWKLEYLDVVDNTYVRLIH
jgi:hypothetical protein